MEITNIQTIPGKKIVASFGVVSGSTIRAKNILKDFGAGLKNIVGGELKGYTALLEEARMEATERMLEVAKEKGAMR